VLQLSNVLVDLANEIPAASLKLAYEKLSQAYRTDGKIVLNSPAMQLAYLQARMPATVGVLTRVLRHLPITKIQALLDLGSGPGSVLWAAHEAGLGIDQATCIDQSAGLLNFGQKLLQLSDMTCEVTWHQADILRYKTDTSPDLVTMSYVLNELDQDGQKQVLQKAWEVTREFVVLVEPGTPKGFSNIRQARDYLIQQGAHIVAPCTHERACPMAGDDWCHFSVRVQRSKAHKDIKGTLPYEDEKYSYLVVSKSPIDNRPSARIVKSPLTSTGLVELELCDQNGLSRVKVSKRQKELYKQARKAEWGDGW